MSFVKQYIINKLDYFRYLEFRSKWRELNKHNLTNAGCVFPAEAVCVGDNSYGTLNVISYGNKNESLRIGDFCSIAGNVHFILSGEHDYSRISMYPYRKIMLGGESESISRGPIIIEDDVWIGYGCIILSGVKIGRGAVIGAGTVVAKDIPQYAVFVNGKIQRYRFEEEKIELASKIDYKKINKGFVEQNIEELESNRIEAFELLSKRLAKMHRGSKS